MNELTLVIVGEPSDTVDRLSATTVDNCELLCADSWRDALATLAARPVAGLIMHCLGNERDTIDALQSITSHCPAVALVLVADQPSTDLVIGAFRCGARDVIKGVLDAQSLRQCLDRIGLLASVASAPIRVGDNSDGAIAGDNGSQTALGNGLPRLRVDCFGAFRVLVNERPIRRPLSRKGRGILVYLALRREQLVHRSLLMDQFWPDSSPESARNCLNFTLHGVRERLREAGGEHDWILYKDHHYLLNPDLAVWSDAGEFLHVSQLGSQIENERGLIRAVTHYERALELYGHGFMAEDRNAGWPARERERLQEIYLTVLDKLSGHYHSTGRQSAAIQLCNSILQLDGPRENIHRRLMACYYELGDRDKAMQQFLRCKTALADEFDAGPARSTLELARKIRNESTNMSGS